MFAFKGKADIAPWSYDLSNLPQEIFAYAYGKQDDANNQRNKPAARLWIHDLDPAFWLAAYWQKNIRYRIKPEAAKRNDIVVISTAEQGLVLLQEITAHSSSRLTA